MQSERADAHAQAPSNLCQNLFKHSARAKLQSRSGLSLMYIRTGGRIQPLHFRQTEIKHTNIEYKSVYRHCFMAFSSRYSAGVCSSTRTRLQNAALLYLTLKRRDIRDRCKTLWDSTRTQFSPSILSLSFALHLEKENGRGDSWVWLERRECPRLQSTVRPFRLGAAE